ncbi:MAG TPA: cyclase family protein [Methylomirabilota bacterium]|jgi:kynurenine formamidase|nr:cyclase family protein [Methylomirabilota bacterium]
MTDVSRRGFMAGAASTAAASAVAASSASAQPGTPSEVNVEAFISGVRAARVFDLNFTWDARSPLLSLNPPFAFALNATHQQTHEIFGSVPGSQVSWTSEIMYFSGQHGAATIDAIGHIGRNLRLHGGVDAVAATARPDGIGNDLGIDAFPPDLLFSRGVLLDVARVVAGGRADPLDPGFVITARHLEDAARAHGVQVRRGDSVLVRTGWGQYFAKDNARYLGEKSPGPGVDAARWLVAQGVRLTGTDTATYEVRPAVHGKELFPVHMLLIADSGVYIVENANLEELGAANVRLFVLVVPPLRIRGASGSPLRMLALTPRRS